MFIPPVGGFTDVAKMLAAWSKDDWSFLWAKLLPWGLLKTAIREKLIKHQVNPLGSYSKWKKSLSQADNFRNNPTAKVWTMFLSGVCVAHPPKDITYTRQLMLSQGWVLHTLAAESPWPDFMDNEKRVKEFPEHSYASRSRRKDRGPGPAAWAHLSCLWNSISRRQVFDKCRSATNY